MSQENHDAYIIYDISQKNKKAFRLDHLGKEKVGLLDLHTKNIEKRSAYPTCKLEKAGA